MIAGQRVLCDVFKCECSAALRHLWASVPEYHSLVCQPLIQQPAQQQFLLVLWLQHDYFGDVLCAFSYILSFTCVPLNSNLIKWVLHTEEMTKPGDRPMTRTGFKQVILSVISLNLDTVSLVFFAFTLLYYIYKIRPWKTT